MLPLPLPPSVFSIHVALQIATAIAIAFALEVAMLVAIKLIWAPNRALFLNFK